MKRGRRMFERITFTMRTLPDSMFRERFEISISLEMALVKSEQVH